MRRRLLITLAISLSAAATPAGAQTATPPPTPGATTGASLAALTPGQQVKALEERLDALEPQLHDLEVKLEQSLARWRQATWAEQAAIATLTSARARLSLRIRSLYILGPTSAWRAMFNAESLTDIKMIQDVLAPAVAEDADRLERASALEREAAAAREESERLQRDALTTYAEMHALVAELQVKVATVAATAQAAGIDTTDIVQRSADLQQADEKQGERLSLAFDGWGYGDLPQDRLMKLVGEGCAIPDGLEDTGAQIHGEASWYGWENGPGTASGMTFDPKAFTAAHLTLPFGTFLRVRNGERCAIVLINDRGPYVAGRILDLSWGSAQSLHVGVADIRADILVPDWT